MIPSRFVLSCCQLWAFPWHLVSSALHSHPQLPAVSWHLAGSCRAFGVDLVRRSRFCGGLRRDVTQGKRGCLMGPGFVVRVMFVSSLVIPGLERARDNIRGEMSGIAMSLRLSRSNMGNSAGRSCGLIRGFLHQSTYSYTGKSTWWGSKLHPVTNHSHLSSCPNWGCHPSHCLFLTI